MLRRILISLFWAAVIVLGYATMLCWATHQSPLAFFGLK